MLPSSTILLVEDSLPDYLVTKSTLKAAGLINPIKHCTTSLEAMNYLNRNGVYEQNSPRPTLILIDLALPDKSAQDLIKNIKENDSFRSIPIIVLADNGDVEIKNTYQDLGADSYMIKPINFETLQKSIQRIKSYYFELIFHGKV